MAKLIIHETDCHGCGRIYYNGRFDTYAYDDNADVKIAVQSLIDIGFINPDDVVIFEEDEIYTKLADLLEIEEAYYDKVLDEVDPDYAYEEFEGVCDPEEEAE